MTRTALTVGMCLMVFGAANLRGQEGNHGVPLSNGVRSIAITATDRVVNQADLATVHIGYTLYGPTHDAAYAAGSRASQAITRALLDAGVAADAIQSLEQSLAATDADVLKPLSPHDKVARAFTIQQTWTVRVAAKDGTEVLDKAIHAGANDSGAIDWSLRDANAAQAAAAAKAIQRARSQAEAMANGLHVRLGSLQYASNEVNAAPTPQVEPKAMFRMTFGLAAPPPPPPPPLAINPQQIETVATVYAVFAIE